METSPFLLLKSLLKKHNYIIDFEELEFQLLSHPSYPSLHSITGVLSHFKIENAALKVPIEREILSELPDTFLSVLVNSEYVLVESNGQHIKLFNGQNTRLLTYDEFMEGWRGIVVAIEPNEEEHTSRRLRGHHYRYLSMGAVLLFLTGVFIYKEISPSAILHFILSLIGVAVSVLILRHEMGYKSKVLESICKMNESTSCETVFHSKAAFITKHIKLSDICISYFSGLVVYWMLSALTNTTNDGLLLISALSLPVTLYSIYNQGIVIKKWCPLCLTIVGILWFQFASLAYAYQTFPRLSIDYVEVAHIAISFLLMGSLWATLKSLMVRAVNFKKTLISYNKLIKNYRIFNSLLSKGRLVDSNINGITEKEIRIGNVESAVQLTLVTHPLCSYCRKAHFELHEVLKKNPQNVSLTLRFSIKLESINDPVYKLVNRLHELYHSASPQSFHTALDEAYSDDLNPNLWLQKWDETEHHDFMPIFQSQTDWYHQNDINFTPALFVNGSEFPKEYDWAHLSYFIEDLKDDIEEIKSRNTISA